MPGAETPADQNADTVPQRKSHAGMMVWSIVTIAFCAIPGIVAVVQTSKANRTADDQEGHSHIKAARIWNVIGMVLGVLILAGIAAKG